MTVINLDEHRRDPEQARLYRYVRDFLRSDPRGVELMREAKQRERATRERQVSAIEQALGEMGYSERQREEISATVWRVLLEVRRG